MTGALPASKPTAHPDPNPALNETDIWADNAVATNAKVAPFAMASDGGNLESNDFIGSGKETLKTGLYALEKADLFNMLCIPPYLATGDVDTLLVGAAAVYCEKRRAMLLVDSPSDWKDKSTAKSKFTDSSKDNVGTRNKNAALFFPRLMEPNPLRENQIEDFVPCGAVAGVFARTDSQRGVWKAPAGFDATLVGVPQLSVPLTDAENGELNPLGINCLRALPAAGPSRLGRAHTAGRRPTRLGMEIHPGPPHRALHRRKPVSRHAMGGVRAERRAAVGADPPQRRRVHAESLPAGRLSGQDARARRTSSSATRKPRPRTTSTSAS